MKKSEVKEMFSFILAAYENTKDIRDDAYEKFLHNCVELVKIEILKEKGMYEERTQRLS